MVKVYELRKQYWNGDTTLLGCSYSKELILQLAIDMFDLQRINEFYLLVPEDNFYHHLDFLNQFKKNPKRIDMIKYQEEHKERVGKV